MTTDAIDLGQERMRRREGVFLPPMLSREEICPTCKFPLADVHHGWLKDYSEHHAHSADCHRYFGHCLIPCPTCSGGVVGKRHAQLINQLFGDAHIPFYAKDWLFSNYPGDARAKRAVQSWLAKALDGSLAKRGVYLSGEVGKGKTSLAISALQFAIRRGHAGVFITTKELFSILKESIAASQRLQRGDIDATTRFEATKGAQLLKLLREVEWAVLDDLGVEAGSKYEIGELYLLLEARRANGMYTIFTSNKDRSDLEQYWHSNADDARRIIDRLGEYCLSIPVEGSNQRRKGQEV